MSVGLAAFQAIDADMAKISKGKANAVKFDPAKLKAFADKLGRDQSDVLDALAYSIIRGNAPPHVLDLVAGPYDDFMTHVVSGSIGVQDFILVDSNRAAREYHEMEYTLGTVSFVNVLNGQRLRGTFGGRLFLCEGHEYLDPDAIEHFARGGNLRIIVCNHLKGDPNVPKVTAARMWWDEANGSYAVATPFDERFVDWIKLVSKQDKKWDADAKLWYFSPQVCQEVKAKIESIYGSCHFTGPQSQAKMVAAAPSDTYGKFCKLVGLAALDKARKEAVLRFHPDRGGDPAKMSELNMLWAQITEALK